MAQKEKRRDYQRNRAAYCRKHGLCKWCNVKVLDGKMLCPDCASKDNRRNKAHRETARADGRCTRCLSSPATPGNLTCETCRALTRARFAAHKAAGKCYLCGEVCDGGKAFCKKHLGMRREKQYELAFLPKARLSHTRRRDRLFGRECNLSLEDYAHLVSQPCAYCGHFNSVTKGSGLDRLNNVFGHCRGNVVSCCRLCNVARGDNFSVEEMKSVIGPSIDSVKMNRASNGDACHETCERCKSTTIVDRLESNE
jgi:hypothetical protein